MVTDLTSLQTLAMLIFTTVKQWSRRKDDLMDSMKKLAIRNINDAVKNDSLIIFVGAGVSANSGLPKWSELIDEFKSDLKLGKDESNYLKIAQYYYDEVGKQKYFQKITSIFQPHINARPNKIHDQIFRITPRHIITTNYDSLLESKMNSTISKYEVIKKDMDIPYSKAGHYLIKMHGDLKEKNIVLKEDDYLDYENNFYMISTLIKALIMNNTVLFIGYSLNDSTFNSIFRMIQKGFKGNAQKAYFFSVDKQNTAEIEYYKKKGIQVIISEKQSGGEKQRDAGRCTVDFLKQINSDTTLKPTTSEQLWNNISFLDELSFIDTNNVAKYTGLTLFPSTKLNWSSREADSLNIVQNKDITEFLETKTLFNKFEDFNRTRKYQFKQNPVLSEGYKLYMENRYEDAKKYFREIANKAFIQQDYWNYLIAEFNVKNIYLFQEDNHSSLNSNNDIDDLDKVVTSLSSNGDTQTRKSCIFFRDEIKHWGFINKQAFKINNLLDKLRYERVNYQSGGLNINSNLQNAQIEFRSLMAFIKANCICVFQYEEFKEVVNRYFECLLIAYDNSNYHPNRIGELNTASSIINNLSLNDVKDIVPYLNIDNAQTLMKSYKLSKIRVEKDAIDYLLSTISTLSKKIQKGINLSDFNLLINYISFLSMVKLDDINVIIPLLSNYPIIVGSFSPLGRMLTILVSGKNLIKVTNYEKLIKIIDSHLNKIIKKSLIESFNDNFRLYALLMQKLTDNNSKQLFIRADSLGEKLSWINNNSNKLTKIVDYKYLLYYLYQYFDQDLKKLVDQILVKYEKLDCSKLDLHFIETLVMGKVYTFDSKKKMILNFEIKNVNKKPEQTILYPDPRKQAISDLFRLIQQGYFTLNEIKEKLNLQTIRGTFPEVDWTLLNDHSEQVILKLVKGYTFSLARKKFGTSEEKKKYFDDWLLKQGRENKIKYFDKNPE